MYLIYVMNVKDLVVILPFSKKKEIKKKEEVIKKKVRKELFKKKKFIKRLFIQLKYCCLFLKIYQKIFIILLICVFIVQKSILKREFDSESKLITKRI